MGGIGTRVDMSIWSRELETETLRISLKASDYDAPHATMYVEAHECEFEFTLDREDWVKLADHMYEFYAVPRRR